MRHTWSWSCLHEVPLLKQGVIRPFSRDHPERFPWKLHDRNEKCSQILVIFIADLLCFLVTRWMRYWPVTFPTVTVSFTAVETVSYTLSLRLRCSSVTVVEPSVNASCHALLSSERKVEHEEVTAFFPTESRRSSSLATIWYKLTGLRGTGFVILR